MPTQEELQSLGLSEDDYNDLVRRKAYELWRNRGTTFGSADDDWYNAQTAVNFNIAITLPLVRLSKAGTRLRERLAAKEKASCDGESLAVPIPTSNVSLQYVDDNELAEMSPDWRF